MKKQLIMKGRQGAFLVLVPLCFLLAGGRVCGNPQGMTVVSGAAQTTQRGGTLQITTTSPGAVLRWNSFNIAPGETTIFQEPSPASIVFNNINNASPSAIFGSLHANGIVVLQNSSGFYFGPNAFVQTGGLVLTTAAINPWSSGGGAGWSFDGPPTAAPIVNYGTLQTASGGSLFLIAKQIDNQGTIAAPGGTAALVAGQEVLLSLRPDGLSLSAPVRLPSGSVNNQGRVVADAGQVLLQAQTVNNSGVLQANSVRQNNGVIELYASQDIQLAGASVIQANGGGGISSAGSITVKSGGSFSDNPGSQISATGGAAVGNGGNIEVSAPNILSLSSGIDTSAQAGWRKGLFLMDPENIVLGTFTSGSASAGTSGVIPATGNSGTVDVDVATAFENVNTGTILLEASGTITLQTPWTLPASLNTLTLEAGNSITFNAGDSLTAQNNCSVTLLAGVKSSGFGSSPATISSITSSSSSTKNSITLKGSAGVETAAGGITLIAGGGITTGIGTIVSTGGGSILLQSIGQSISLSSSSTGATTWVLPDNNSGMPASVTLQAGNNITMASGGGITAGQNWTINLLAGANFFPNASSTPQNPSSVVQNSTSGVNSITLNGSASLQTANQNINLIAGGGITAGGVTSGGATAGPGTLQTTAGGSILLHDSQSMTLNSAWTLPDNNSSSFASLTLQSGNDITLNDSLTVGKNWNINLTAGADVNTGIVTANSTPNASTITLSDMSSSSPTSVQSANGSITVLAGNSVTVGSGGIVTGLVLEMDNANNPINTFTGIGGNIDVRAVAGNVDCGTSTKGYDFQESGAAYVVDPNLGGISTASGGNVKITAGGNITAEMPDKNSYFEDPGSGAFGANPGNVILQAGGAVAGHYVLANGTGIISAQNAGTSGTGGLALSLIKGGWTVNATDNIFLQEVRNPNGMFNTEPQNPITGGSNPFQNVFDYDPLDYVVLQAMQGGVTILGVPPRTAGSAPGLIFPPNLTIEAAAGGITLDQSLILFPSPQGQLVMTTTDGGSLNGMNQFISLSDSQSVEWVNTSTFAGKDPANNELMHLNDPYPVLINISGSVSDFGIDSPKAVEMYAAGNIVDSYALIQNLHPSDTTVLSAGGEILDHSSFVIVALPPGEKPDFTALELVSEQFLPGSGFVQINNPNLNPTLLNEQNQFTYDRTTGSLKFSGPMSSAVEQALLSMSTPFLPAASIESIYAQSLLESPGLSAGYQVAGPGTFRINAGSIDLGNGTGLVSLGIDGYAALGPYTARGADIHISTSGDLNMIASGITSDYGGAINITCGGAIDVGSLLVPPASSGTSFGIVSLFGGNISVIAANDINVDGSRIAAYDGGDVLVESLYGDVNAGDGGNTAVVNKYYLNKKGQEAIVYDVLPASGILATSFPKPVPGGGSGHVGNITIETPEGNIVASKGGIEQLVLGPVVANNASINLIAGSKNSDGTVKYVGDVDASGSGVFGGHVNISATGNVNGLIVASLGANVSALQNISATVLSQGGATVNAGGTVSGTIVGVGSVSVSGASDVAAAFSAGAVSASGAVSGAAVAAAPTGSSSASAAATTQQVNQTTQTSSDLASNGAGDDNDPLKKKKKAQLMEYQGRVTVLLPE
jgi:filamentous hemagglutinin family protein